ncbi:methylamine utilization protein [Pseudohongiella sp. SYSU M77423]|uniref:methylamine utilization protein n=1 Tax=unclassified Pseudohongiella TaxID=2629611 RepID=UPI001F15C55C|nr:MULTISPECIES: methylamine utilization protein [unclassified Pseudohongiella]MDH7943441.1 methylamine utilization protein [Pseudohongiella sp. SYSU M77423]
MACTKTGVSIAVMLSLSHAAYGGDLEVLIRDEAGNPVEGAVVELINTGLPQPADWPQSAVIDQINKEFVEPVIAIVAGTSVSFPNSDDVHHHVYSFSPTKRFELPLYTGDPAAPVVFETPGVVTIGCNIHDWMVGYIYIGESHLMAISDMEGVGKIVDLPAGTYTARMWHKGLGVGQELTEFTVEVPAAGVAQHSVSLTEQPAFATRRAPLPGLRSY